MTIGVVSIGFQVFTLTTLAYYMVVPLGQRAAEDLASVITHAAETVYSLPDAKKKTFSERMFSKHELLITSDQVALEDSTSLLPYLFFLETSLSKELGIKIKLKQSQSEDGQSWFWADIPVSGTLIRFGFPRSRIGVNPPIVFFLILTIGILLTLLTAAALARRLTVPIDQLYKATRSVGKGRWPEPIRIKKQAPEELVVLTQAFNRMNIQVRELLSNRTTLLAGIAHDLRTPLTQIQLAIALLPDEGGDPELMKSIQDDLDLINQLIGESLSISMELDQEEETPTDIRKELSDIINNLQTNDVEIRYSDSAPCGQISQSLAFRRVFSNLLNNAIRYGLGKPVSVEYKCDHETITIRVIDQGSGIPAEEVEAVFQPFYRLEKSRGSGTGGSGLGLAIVRQLADTNRWDVQLLPHRDGGTAATLVIPCKQTVTA